MNKITWKEGIEQLEGMFPTISPLIIESTLRENGGHMEHTIDILLQLSLEMEESKQFIEQKSQEVSDEQFAKEIQEREYGMYKALGGKKTLNEMLQQTQSSSTQNKDHEDTKETKESFWERVTESTKDFFKDIFSSSYSYTPLETTDKQKKD